MAKPYRSAQKLRRDNCLSEISENSDLLTQTLENLGLSGLSNAYTTTATAAGTTTLTVLSHYKQFFTGATTQTVKLPVTSTLTLGQGFYFANNSTGVVTVQSSGANDLVYIAPGARAIVTCIAITGTGTSSWSVAYLPSRSGTTNYSVTSQSVSAATRTYLTGSALTIPAAGLKIGTLLNWKFSATKTGAGTATSTVDVAFGTAGTTADTARVSFTKPAGTAAADEAFFEINAIVRGPISASGVVVGELVMSHNLAATGHAQIPLVVVNTVSSAFDVTTAGMIVGVCLTTGASDAITVQYVSASAANLAASP